MSRTIFPGGEPHAITAALRISPDDLHPMWMNKPNVWLIVFGYADYQFSGYESHHQTRFMYEVKQVRANDGRWPPDRTNDILRDSLVLESFIFGRGNDAD